MTHIPGHHGRGMEAGGPLVKPGDGYQERDATKSTMLKYDEQLTIRVARIHQREARDAREAEIEAGLVHLTPAMEEALAKVVRDNPGADG